MVTIEGREAIAEAELADHGGWAPVQLHAYGNEIDGGGPITIDKAREIAREDPALVWCEVPLREYLVLWNAYAFALDRRSVPTADALRVLCAAAESWLTEHEGPARSIIVRPTRQGEADGTYSDGGSATTCIPMVDDGHDSEDERVANLVHLAYGHVLENAEQICEEAGVSLFGVATKED